MKLIKNIFIKIIWLVLILLVVFNVYNFISINVLKKDIASVNGYAFLEVVSGSMEPTIKIGDIIVINTKADNYQENDIITFYDVNGSFVTHRLVKLNEDTMITKGDANDSEDEELETKNIVGKYIFKISGAGKLIASLKNPFVMLLILIIGIVLCLLVSTDNDLMPKDLTDEEKAFLEYKKYYSTKPKKLKEEKKEQVEEKEIISLEAEVIGEITYVSVEELEEQQREEEISKELREKLKAELRNELKEELRREIRLEMQNKNNNKKKNKNRNKNQQKSNNNNKKNKHQQRKNKTSGYHGNKKQTRK